MEQVSEISQAIFDAAGHDNLDAVQQMLEKDPELVRARDFDQRTPLHRAASRNALRCVKFLLDRGADPNAASVVGDRPLHLASLVETVELLIAGGADPHAEDISGVSPFDWAVREQNQGVFLALAQTWASLYSPKYQLLLACQKARLAASTDYQGDYHHITVERLGKRNGEEHCLGWRHGGTIAGWVCYRIADMEEVYFGDPLEELPEPDRSKRPANALEDIDSFSLPRNWLLIQDDDGNREGLYDLLDGEGLDMTCAAGPDDARKLFQQEAFDGVIADKLGALVLRDIHTGRLKGPDGNRKVVLVLTEAGGLDEVPDLLRLDVNGCEVSNWVENFMDWLD